MFLKPARSYVYHWQNPETGEVDTVHALRMETDINSKFKNSSHRRQELNLCENILLPHMQQKTRGLTSDRSYGLFTGTIDPKEKPVVSVPLDSVNSLLKINGEANYPITGIWIVLSMRTVVEQVAASNPSLFQAMIKEQLPQN